MADASAMVVVFGATGMVGGQVLRAALADPTVAEVIAIGRRAPSLEHAKLTAIEHADFTDFSELEGILAAADVVQWCLAVYQSQVTPDDYEKITVDFLATMVGTLERINQTARICLHGAAGARPDQTARAVFSQVKGRAENVLTGSMLADHLVFRPALIVPSDPVRGRFYPRGLLEGLFRLFPALGICDDDLGVVMNHAGLHEAACGVWDNREIRAALARVSTT